MAMEESEDKVEQLLGREFMPPSRRTRITAWPEAHERPHRSERRGLSLDERGITSADSFFNEAAGQHKDRSLTRFDGGIGLSGGLIFNNHNAASERLKKFQQMRVMPLGLRTSLDVPTRTQQQQTESPPVAEKYSGSGSRWAKASWKSAIEVARKEARAKLEKKRREEKSREELRRDVWDALKSFIIFAVVVMSLGTVLFLVERDELYERTRDKFVFADRLDAGYCAWMGAVYVGYLSAHRVGYGDILVTTAAGKWLVMLFASLTTPLSVVFTLKCSKLMKRFVGNLSEKFIARHGGKYVDAFYVSTFMAALLILMVVNMLFLVTLRGDDGMRLTYTDAFWYSWATYTTVGYGDIGFATLPSVTLFTWAVQYSFFVIGAILLDTLISCAYTLLLVDEEDEDEGGLKKSISKLVDVESVSEDSQSQNDDTSASPLVEAISVPERLEITNMEEP